MFYSIQTILVLVFLILVLMTPSTLLQDLGTGDYSDIDGVDGLQPDPETTTTLRPILSSTVRPRPITRRPVLPALPPIPDSILPLIPALVNSFNTDTNAERPWLNQNRTEESTVYSRFLTFLTNAIRGFFRIDTLSELFNYFTYQVNRFVDVFRYQGFDLHRHFNHCTQRVEGCRYFPYRDEGATPRTTTTVLFPTRRPRPPNTTISVTRRPTVNRNNGSNTTRRGMPRSQSTPRTL